MSWLADLEPKPPHDLSYGPLLLASLMERKPQAPRDEQAQAMILDLIAHGYLIGVEVFGAENCCEHGIDSDECETQGYGLCDMFGPHSVGSDCNRAVRVLMRPSDDIEFPPVAAALTDGSSP